MQERDVKNWLSGAYISWPPLTKTASYEVILEGIVSAEKDGNAT